MINMNELDLYMDYVYNYKGELEFISYKDERRKEQLKELIAKVEDIEKYIKLKYEGGLDEER